MNVPGDADLSQADGGPIAVLPLTFVGWMYWRCWDEAQQLVVRIQSDKQAPVARGGDEIRANGLEHYLVEGVYRATPVQIEVDRRMGRFLMTEPEADQSINGEQFSVSTYEGHITPDMQRIETRPGGCEPELTLRAAEGVAESMLPSFLPDAISGSIPGSLASLAALPEAGGVASKP